MAIAQALLISYGAFDTGPVVEPGSASFTAPGSFNFVVPLYNTLTADVRGAGGGGSGSQTTGIGNDEIFATTGQNGGNSSFGGSVIGNGGQGAQFDGTIPGTPGNPGTASGGDTNITGGGAAGGLHSVSSSANGGNGGRAVKTYASGELTPGSTVTVVVGAGGEGGGGVAVGQTGANGLVSISWE